MKYVAIFPYYLGWHYSRGIVEMITNFKTFLIFIFNFFSISVLFKTLFTPFQRLKGEYKGGLDVGDFMENLIANTIMRIVGFFVRSFVIFIGLLSMLITLILEIIIFCLWMVLPGILILLFVSSLWSIFKIV